MNITYSKVGDYYLPDLILTEKEDNRPIGIWGARRRDYLKEHKRVLFDKLLISGELHSHLADVNEQAEDMLFRLVKDMARAEGITEDLKEKDMLLWVGLMNNIQNRAREIVYEEVICG